MTLNDIVTVLGGFVSLGLLGKLLISVGEIKRVVKDTHAGVGKLDKKVEEHGERILTLELINGLTGERRHTLRRTDDQHLRDVRKMVNGEEL